MYRTMAETIVAKDLGAELQPSLAVRATEESMKQAENLANHVDGVSTPQNQLSAQ